MSSSWTMRAASGSRTAAGSAPLSRTSFRAPHETCSRQRSIGWNHAASRLCFHCHDEVTVEVPIGSLSDTEFLAILLELPDWATGLPARWQGAFGAALSGSRPSIRPIRCDAPIPTTRRLEHAIDVYVDDMSTRILDRSTIRFGLEREDDEEFVANLADNVAPLTETGRAAALARQQGRLPVPRGRRAVVHDLSGPFSLLWLQRARQPPRLADARRGHDHDGGRQHHQGLAARHPQ